ncbi:MAG: lysylphosphatidylglycerol synthase domain-containing protein, partial [Chloroflexi bacterium]|nr:lysylphosphatidylglycerol synthase domain-containing protein [Chloroflexota bacterium]
MSTRTIRRWIVLSSVLVAAIFLVVGGMILLRLAQGVALPVALLPLAPVVLLLGVGSYSARFLRWHLLVSRITSPLSWLASARIYTVGFALGFTPGRIGELVKFTLLREQTGKSEVETVAVFPIERLTEAAAFLGLALAGAWAAHSSVARLSLEAKLALVALPALALLPMAFAVMGRRHHPRARSSLDVVVRGALRITGIRAITGALACAFLARAFDLMLF